MGRLPMPYKPPVHYRWPPVAGEWTAAGAPEQVFASSAT